MTQALAVLGAVTGTTGSVLGVLSYRRDRARMLLTAFAGKAAAHEGGVMHIEVTNVGRRPTMITEIQVLHGRWRGLDWAIRRARSRRMRAAIGRIGQIEEVGTPLDSGIDDPLTLDPNSHKKYVLHATEFKQDRSSGGRQFTYVWALQSAPRKVLARRVPFEGSAASWKEL